MTPDEQAQQFAERFAQAIADAGLTIREVCERSGMHQTSVGRYKLGQVVPSVVTAARLADAVGADLRWLAGSDMQ